MKAAVWEGPSDLVIRDLPIPSVGKNEALVKVKYTGICGSDLFHVTGKNPKVRPPIVLGHEFSGTIHSIGDREDSSNWGIGERVSVNPLIGCGKCVHCLSGDENLCQEFSLMGHQVAGAFAEYIAVPLNKLVRIPDTISFEDACILEPISIAVHAFTTVHIQPGDEVLILGGGTIGLLSAQIARCLGATRIAVTDVNDYHLDVIRNTGFTAVDSRVEDTEAIKHAYFGGEGADVVIEAVGLPQTALQMMALAKPKGKVIVVGLHKGDPPPVALREMFYGEKKLEGKRFSNAVDFDRAVRLLEAGLLDTSIFGNYRLPLNKINHGFDLMRSGTDTIKVFIEIDK